MSASINAYLRRMIGRAKKMLRQYKSETKTKLVALTIADFRKFTIAYLYYCQHLPLSIIARYFNTSTSKLKRELSKFSEIYDIDYMCHEYDFVKPLKDFDTFREKEGRYKCPICGRYVTKRGRVQHLMTLHKDILRKYV